MIEAQRLYAGPPSLPSLGLRPALSLADITQGRGVVYGLGAAANPPLVGGVADVAEVAVIGIPDDVWGEAVKAIVVRKPGTAPDPERIIAFARSQIAAFKSPKSRFHRGLASQRFWKNPAA